MNRWGRWLTVLFFVTFPWDISKVLFPPYQSAPETSTTLTFVRIATMLLIIWACSAMLQERVRQRLLHSFNRKILGSVIPLFLAVGISYIGSFQEHNTLIEAFRLAVLCALGISIAISTDTPRIYNIVWHIIVGMATLTSVIGIIQYVSGIGIWGGGVNVLGFVRRVNATFIDPNIFARYLDISILGSMILLLTKEWKLRIWLILALILQLTALLFTHSRTAWLIIALGFFVFVLFVPNRIRLKLTGIYIIFGGVMWLIPSVKSRLMTFVTGPGVAIGGREHLLKAGWTMFIEHPIKGVGLGNFQWAIEHQYQRFLPVNGLVTRPHTSLMTIAAEMGIIGLLAMLIFLGVMIWENTRINPISRGYLLAMTCGVLVIWLSSQGEGRFFEDPLLWAFWGLSMASHGLRHNTT